MRPGSRAVREGHEWDTAIAIVLSPETAESERRARRGGDLWLR